LLRKHPILKKIISCGQRYKDGEINIEDLQKCFSVYLGALEGDVPLSIRKSILKAEAWIDSIRFTVNDDSQLREVIKVLEDLDNEIAKYD